MVKSRRKYEKDRQVFCDDMYQGYESKMISHLETKNANTFEKNVDPRFTAKGRLML